jgi:hypothetical protein
MVESFESKGEEFKRQGDSTLKGNFFSNLLSSESDRKINALGFYK